MQAAETARKPAISVTEAERLVLANALPAPVERRLLREAHGCVLREPIRADRDFPPFDRVTMDGIALSFAEYEQGRRSFRIAGVQAAGAPPQSLLDRESCYEVMTGAVLPRGCDLVVPVEEIRREGNKLTIGAETKPARDQYIHHKGSDHALGELLIDPGTLLGSPELAVCATVGASRVPVSVPLRVAVMTTGDELVEVDRRPEAHQIRASNGYAIEAAITRSGRASCELFHARDDRGELTRLIRELLEQYDILIMSGGVSAGKFDLVPPVLEECGVEILFHRVAQRPGFPLLFGRGSIGRAVFGLPGNPVSSLVSTHRYVLPYVERCLGITPGEREAAVLEEDYRFEPKLTLFLPVHLQAEGSGRVLARPMPVNSSGDLAGLLHSGGFLELPPDDSIFAAGTVRPLYRWQ
ncbi:MAG TPA: molybdopterin molybdotransferase MoeA [Spirochaetia bacterium]|nr:molybdopterin molybdotransferase MoeA [Spirochaetia bacterium]